jgi:hypothetical protein
MLPDTHLSEPDKPVFFKLYVASTIEPVAAESQTADRATIVDSAIRVDRHQRHYHQPKPWIESRANNHRRLRSPPTS